MTSFLQAVRKANEEIYTKLLDFDPQWYEKGDVGAGGDISYKLDLMAEEIFVKYLSPFGQIYSEEGGLIGEGNDTIIIDPIDGSDNLKSNFPYYGASIALKQNGHITAAVISNFANGDFFEKSKSGHFKRSLLNQSDGQSVVLNPHAEVGLFERAWSRPDVVAALKEQGLKFRSPGAVALSLAYAHEVKFMLFVGGMRPFDIEAGCYFCEDLHIYKSEDMLVVSHNKDVFAKILSIFDLTNSIT